MTKKVVRASFMAHLRAGLDWPRGERDTEPLGPVLLHPAGSAENDLLRSVERPASRHADRRGATRVAIHFILTLLFEVADEPSGPYARPLHSVNEKHARDAVGNGANMFGDRADELAVKPVRNKNRIKANVIAKKTGGRHHEGILIGVRCCGHCRDHWRRGTQRHSGAR